MLIRILQSKYYWLLPVLFWFLVIVISWVWNHMLFEHSIRDIAYERGRIMYEMIRLAKINPVLMAADPMLFRQQNMKDIRYRIVSKHPRNPENSPDPWESAALSRFERGSSDIFQSFLNQEEGGYFRYIGPVYMESSCLVCHAAGNSKVGDVRGGISVTVMAKPIVASHAGSHHTIDIMHIIGFLLLSTTSVFLMFQLRRQWWLLQQTRDELKEKEQFLSGVANCMQDGLVVLNQGGEVVFANPESEWMLGRSTSELMGLKFVDLIYADRRKDFDVSQSVINQTLQDGEIRKETDDLLIDSDGKEFPVSLSVSPLLHDDRPNGVVVTFSDISARRQAEEQRSNLERELNQMHKMEAVGQLAGGIAHEINTPIQYVGDNLRFLQDVYRDVVGLLDVYRELLAGAETIDELKPQVEAVNKVVQDIDLQFLKEEAPKAIEQSVTGAEQVAHIVLAMKEFAHPGQKQMAPADLNRVVENTVAVSKNEWKYVADTELHLAPELPQVKCMGGEVSQVVLNLIVNAAHAIQAAGREEKGVISVATGLRGNYAEIRVTDNGTGIPAKAQPYVFNPFFTTKDVGKGTGQGLAICQDVIVGKHRGELFFETEEGAGTTFVIRLPLHPVENEEQVE